MHLMITGDENSKRINIPTRFVSLFKLRPEMEIEIDLLRKAPERVHKLRVLNINGAPHLDLYTALPTKQVHANRDLIIFKLTKNRIFVCSKGACVRLELPRYLKLDEHTFEAFGLYQGEGYKKQPRDAARVEFVNAEKQLNLAIIKYFHERFRIPIKRWGAYIGYSGNVYSHKQLVDYWSKVTGIPRSNFQKTRFLDTKKIRWTVYGNLHVLIVSSILVEVVLGILSGLQKLSQTSSDWAAAFMRGVLAADAHVRLIKWPNRTTLSMVEIAIENDFEADLYKKILSVLGIEVLDYRKRRKIVITDWSNFKKLNEIGAFSLHPRKQSAFEIGFRNHAKTRAILQLPYHGPAQEGPA